MQAAFLTANKGNMSNVSYYAAWSLFAILSAQPLQSCAVKISETGWFEREYNITSCLTYVLLDAEGRIENAIERCPKYVVKPIEAILSDLHSSANACPVCRSGSNIGSESSGEATSLKAGGRETC
jgi:hypothetical protein